MNQESKALLLQRHRKLPTSTLSAFIASHEIAANKGFLPIQVPAELFAGALLENDSELFIKGSQFGLHPGLFYEFAPKVTSNQTPDYPFLWLSRTLESFPELKPETLVPAAVFLTLLRNPNSGIGAVIQFRSSFIYDPENHASNGESAVDGAVWELFNKQVRQAEPIQKKSWKDTLPRFSLSRFTDRVFTEKQHATI